MGSRKFLIGNEIAIPTSARTQQQLGICILKDLCAIESKLTGIERNQKEKTEGNSQIGAIGISTYNPIIRGVIESACRVKLNVQHEATRK